MVGQIRQGSEVLEVPARNQPHPRRPSRISSLDKGELGVAVGASPPAPIASAAHGIAPLASVADEEVHHIPPLMASGEGCWMSNTGR